MTITEVFWLWAALTVRFAATSCTALADRLGWLSARCAYWDWRLSRLAERLSPTVTDRLRPPTWEG